MYYNWKPIGSLAPVSNGVLHGDIWVGYHCGQGLVNHLRGLKDAGEFVVPWEHTPKINLLHSEDMSGINSDTLCLNASIDRFRQLPGWVKTLINLPVDTK